MTITLQMTTPEDNEQIKRLVENVLGPGRFARTAYRLREQAGNISSFGLSAFEDKELIGAVSFTPLTIDGEKGYCLLGPLVINPKYRGQQIGLRLIKEGCAIAKKEAFTGVLLVGDLSYYERAGFKPVDAEDLKFPGPIVKTRILGFELKDGALVGLKGEVSGFKN